MTAILNLASSQPNDLTTLFTTTGPGAAFNAPKTSCGIAISLIAGTSMTGRLEGSNDGIHWATLQTADTSVPSISTVLVTVSTTFTFLRYNITGLTGTNPTALILLSYDNVN